MSANLLTPRRHRRPSETPQNTLRILSRALSKKSKEDEREKTPDQERQDYQDQQQELEQQTQFNYQQEYDQGQQEVQEEQVSERDLPNDEVGEGLDQVQLEELNDFYDDLDFGEDHEKVYQNDMEGFEHQVEHDHADNTMQSVGEIENRRRASMRHSERFSQNGMSDIALPIGIMPDEALESDIFPESLQFDQHRGNEGKQPIPFSSIDPQSLINHNETTPFKNPIKTSVPKKRVPSSQTKTLNPINNHKVIRYAQTFARKSLSKEACVTLQQTSELFFDQIVDDLNAYTKYSKNKETLNIKSIYLLLKRQRHVDSIGSLLELIDENLPLEDVLEVRRNLHKLQR